MSPLIFFSIFTLIIFILCSNLDYGMSNCIITGYTKITHTSFGSYDSNFNLELFKGLNFTPTHFNHLYIIQIYSDTYNKTIENSLSDPEYHIGEILKCRLSYNEIHFASIPQIILILLIVLILFIMFIALIHYMNTHKIHIPFSD